MSRITGPLEGQITIGGVRCRTRNGVLDDPRPSLLPGASRAPDADTDSVAIADIIRREAAAWISCVLATLEYCRTAAEIPAAVLDTLRPFRQGVDEAVETGHVLRELIGIPLTALAAEVTSLDHAELRRCARGIVATQQITPSFAPTLTAALLRALRHTP